MVNARKVLGMSSHTELTEAGIEAAFKRKMAAIAPLKQTLTQDDYKIIESAVVSSRKFLLQQIPKPPSRSPFLYSMLRRFTPTPSTATAYKSTSYTTNGQTVTRTYKEVEKPGSSKLREEMYYINGQKATADEYRNTLIRMHQVPMSFIKNEV